MAQTEAMLCAPPGLEVAGGRRVEDDPCTLTPAEVDGRISVGMEEVWQRGKQAMAVQVKKWEQKFGALNEELSQTKLSLTKLEAENERMKQALTSVLQRLALMNLRQDSSGELLSPLSPWNVVEPPVGTPQPPSTVEAAALMSGVAPAPTSELSLPSVPDFPYPAVVTEQSAAPGVALSLAEALGQQTPQRMPLSLASSLSPPPAGSPEAQLPAPPAGVTPLTTSSSTNVFTFSLRKADGAELGLNVSHNDTDRVLKVEGIREKGAVEAWNKQCAAGQAEKAIRAGDRIVSVNNIAYDPSEMLEECRVKQLLRLTIVRDEAPKTVSAFGGLRAGASVFVPMGAATTASTPTAVASEPVTPDTAAASTSAARV